MRLIDADRFYINYARRFSREPLKVELFKQFIDAEPTVDVLDKIRDEIEKPLLVERYADTESAKAQAIALSWCLEIIDKYKEQIGE